VLSDPLQHVDQVVVRVDLVQATRCQQALQYSDVPGAQFGPAEQPVTSFMERFP